VTLSASLNVSARAQQQNTVDVGSASARRAIELALSLSDGTAAGQVDRVFADTRTLAASGTEDLDLAGALVDAFGVAQVFARVKAVLVKADPGNANDVLVGRPAANGAALFSAAGDQVRVRPGGVFALACGADDATGYAITGGTGDLVSVTNGGAGSGVTYSIIILGTSA
jgi:hypothetical protein